MKTGRPRGRPRKVPIVPSGGPVLSPVPVIGEEIDRDPLKLHPLMRAAAAEVLSLCKAEALPFGIFEGWRSPERQQSLYQQGRALNHPGPIVTQSRPWDSYHQYGLAADFVLIIGGKWSWDTSGQYDHYWTRLSEIGELYGLEGLEFEKPHLQVATLELTRLKAGSFPGGGDATWEQNLDAALERYPVPV